MIAAQMLAGFARLLSGGRARWIDCVPDTRQRVYFANHTSNLDFAVLWAVLPPEVRAVTRPIAARDYWELYRPLRWLAHDLFHAILIERKKVSKQNHPINLILEQIGNRYSVVIFPEGFRNLEPEIAPFKSGLYHLGKRKPDLELVPVYIDNLNRVLPRGEFLPVPLLTSILFGPPIRVEPGESRNNFLPRAREAVCKLKQIWTER